MPTLAYILDSLILVISLSVDAFASSLSYGAGKIKIPTCSCIVLSLICSGMLWISMLAGSVISRFLPPDFTRNLCFILLFTIGLVRFFDNYIKNYIRKHDTIKLNFSALSLKFALSIYADAESSNIDHSSTLSVKEAIFLAIALSLDGLAVGFSIAMSGTGILLPVVFSLIITVIAVKLGSWLGGYLPRLLPFDFSYLSSVLLILLAFLRL